MQEKFINSLMCPYCGSGFDIEYTQNEEGNEIINGVIRCDCGKHPILEGILILREFHTKNNILQYIVKNDVQKALTLALMKPYVDDILKIIDLVEPKPMIHTVKNLGINLIRYRNINRYNDNITTCNLFDKSPQGTYLKYRFSLESFWTLFPFIKVLKTQNSNVLDLCCGVGHASFVISNYVRPIGLICVDRSFNNLYFAKKRFSPEAKYLCCDCNSQMPFKDNTFSSICMIDAIHYIENKKLLSSEIKRLLNSNGILLLLHMHNSLIENLGAGKPLTPSSWIRLFDDLNLKACREIDIVKDFIYENRLDLKPNSDEKALNNSKAICITGSRQKSLFNTYYGVQTDYLKIKNNLVINPIYKIERDTNSIIVRRDPLTNPVLRELINLDCSWTASFLPISCTIRDSKILDSILHGDFDPRILSHNDLKYIEELMLKFIIINVPSNYA